MHGGVGVAKDRHQGEQCGEDQRQRVPGLASAPGPTIPMVLKPVAQHAFHGMEDPHGEDQQANREANECGPSQDSGAQALRLRSGQAHEHGGQACQEHQPAQVAVKQFPGLGLPAEMTFQDTAAAAQAAE